MCYMYTCVFVSVCVCVCACACYVYRLIFTDVRVPVSLHIPKVIRVLPPLPVSLANNNGSSAGGVSLPLTITANGTADLKDSAPSGVFDLSESADVNHLPAGEAEVAAETISKEEAAERLLV